MKHRMRNRSGFNLIELMIVIAITSLIIAAIAGVFTRSSRLFTLENARAALQQEMRAAMDIMVREIRMAAYDPLNKTDFEIKTAQTTHLRFTADTNGNGEQAAAYNPSAPVPPESNDGRCENTSFMFSAAANELLMICGENTGSQDSQPLLGGAGSDIQVTSVNFDYRNKLDQPETNIPEISSIIATITAQIPAGQVGMESRSYATRIDVRNVQPNASKN